MKIGDRVVTTHSIWTHLGGWEAGGEKGTVEDIGSSGVRYRAWVKFDHLPNAWIYASALQLLTVLDKIVEALEEET